MKSDFQGDRHIIIGTAGHIDHGKTQLVKALTGTDTDRLKEEKIRGVTIDIGFAFLGDNATIIDVPGHERFIKNMVTGVSTIDMVLFVTAADDGIMPQTREHLDILRLLHIQNGIPIITKIDIVEREWVQLVEEELAQLFKGTFLENEKIMPVSSHTGEGIEELKSHIVKRFSRIKPKKDRHIFRLPIDRSFTIKGFGAVVTGTVISGSAGIGDEVEIVPGQKSVKIRGLQIHGVSVKRISPGHRAAINLLGVSSEEVQRGDQIVTPRYFEPSKILDCRLKILESSPSLIKHAMRVRIHLGTTEVMGRLFLLGRDLLNPGEDGHVQILLEKAVPAAIGDRFVIRRYSPPLTIGGGIIIYIPERRYKKSDIQRLNFLERLNPDDPNQLVESVFLDSKDKILTSYSISRKIGYGGETVDPIIEKLRDRGRLITPGRSRGFIHSENFSCLKRRILDFVSEYHDRNPSKPGIKRAELNERLNIDDKLHELLLLEMMKEDLLKEEKGFISLKGFKVHLSDSEERIKELILSTLKGEGFSTSNTMKLVEITNSQESTVRKILNILIFSGDIVKLAEDIFIHRDNLIEVKDRILSYFQENEELTVSKFKEFVHTTRKYAIPILSFFDSAGMTERIGDKRILKNPEIELEK